MQNAARLWPLPLIAGGTRKRILRRRLSRIARDGARVHSLQPYAVADFTTSDVLIWDHIFFIVDDFFAQCSRCLGKTTVGIRRCILVLHRPRPAKKTHFVRHFCEILTGDCLINTAEAVQRGSQIFKPSWNELFAQEADTHLRGRGKTFLEMQLKKNCEFLNGEKRIQKKLCRRSSFLN